MSDMNIDSVLSQIRSLSSQIGSVGGIGGATAPAQAEGVKGGSFLDSLKGAVDAANGKQVEEQKAAQDFELGRTDIASAVLALNSAQVSFKAMTEVRNRMVRAYQDIMNMPI